MIFADLFIMLMTTSFIYLFVEVMIIYGIKFCIYYYTAVVKSLQVNTNYSRMMAEMENNEHAFDINAPGERWTKRYIASLSL